MESTSIQSWSSTARDNLAAAELLTDRGHYRSACSRAWYSSVGACHAMLIHLGVTPPERGNWPNDQLPALLHATLKGQSTRDPRWRAAALAHKQDLSESWVRRLLSDYRPMAAVDADAAKNSIKCARRLVQRTMELLP